MNWGLCGFSNWLEFLKHWWHDKRRMQVYHSGLPATPKTKAPGVSDLEKRGRAGILRHLQHRHYVTTTQLETSSVLTSLICSMEKQSTYKHHLNTLNYVLMFNINIFYYKYILSQSFLITVLSSVMHSFWNLVNEDIYNAHYLHI